MTHPPKFLVMYSGGAGPWAAARRIVDAHGPDSVKLLFADTMMEDEDLYRFLDDSAANLGCELIRIADGRDIWQVFIDERFIGNSRVDPCSKILKRNLMDRWRNEHCDPAITTLVFGLDWAERRRIDGENDAGGFRRRMEATGWRTSFPMNERPYLVKDEVLDWMVSLGLTPPRLYGMGWPHNNCGGLCVKGGIGQMRHLLRTLPDRYLYHEGREAAAIAAIGPTARPFIRIRRDGKTRYLTMREFREECESFPLLGDDQGWGCGGGCAVDDGSEELAAIEIEAA